MTFGFPLSFAILAVPLAFDKCGPWPSAVDHHIFTLENFSAPQCNWKTTYDWRDHFFCLALSMSDAKAKALNVQVLQRHDSSIKEILDTTSYVVLYQHFEEWVRAF